jgi:hypothetical protein
VVDTYEILLDALDNYIDAEKKATREFVESQHSQPMEPPLIMNVAGEKYVIGDEIEEEEKEEGVSRASSEDLLSAVAERYEEPPETMFVHHVNAQVTLMLVGKLSDLQPHQFYNMMNKLADDWEEDQCG